MIESGSRIHETSSVWPKNDAPSGFSMKLRKHLKNKRIDAKFEHSHTITFVLENF